MKYSFEKIKKARNFLKIGSYEQVVEEISPDDNSTRETYKKQIEPWLSAALQSEYLSLLLGSGLTMSVCTVAGVSSSSMDTADFGSFSDKINLFSNQSAIRLGREKANIEDQLRTAYSLLTGYQIDNNDNADQLSECLNNVLKKFSESILESEFNIEECKKNCPECKFRSNGMPIPLTAA